MKQWPSNNKPANPDDLIDELEKIMKFAYKLKRINRGKSIPVPGPDTPNEGSQLLSASQLRWSSKHYKHNALHEILRFALCLGIEQGRRTAFNSCPVLFLQDTLKSMQFLLKYPHSAKYFKEDIRRAFRHAEYGMREMWPDLYLPGQAFGPEIEKQKRKQKKSSKKR